MNNPIAPIVIEGKAQVVMDLENLIKTNIDNIQKGKSELKKLREMVTSSLENDETYRLHNDESKKASKQKLVTKYQIMQQPMNKQLAEKVKTLAFDIKEAGAALSDYLGEYARMTGTDEIEANDGRRWNIVKRYKISSGQQKLF